MERLNIRSDSLDWRAKILANLPYTPFRISKYFFNCVEAPLQGIKFAELEMREKVFAMTGMEALKAGRQITNSIEEGKTASVYWNNEVIEYNSIEHRMLIAMFIHEKVRQNPKVQKALFATKDVFIYHDVGEESQHTSLPEKFFITVLLAERSLLEKLQDISLRFGK
jgi:hypothetical protein